MTSSVRSLGRFMLRGVTSSRSQRIEAEYYTGDYKEQGLYWLNVSGLSSPLKIGVALGGGSARGFAHIGALSCLERHDFAPDLIVGTSFGAIVGALDAAGLTPQEIAQTANSMRWRDLSKVLDFGLHKAALFSGDKLETYLDELVEGRSFSDLKRTLVVVATDLTTGEPVNLTSGPLARALRASASMPGVFSPVELGGRFLVDGGLGSPLPLATLEGYDLDIALGIGWGSRRPTPARSALPSAGLRPGWDSTFTKACATTLARTRCGSSDVRSRTP